MSSAWPVPTCSLPGRRPAGGPARSRQVRPSSTAPPRQQKVDRDEVFLEYTKSICPVGKVVILKPGGRVGITDVTLDPKRIDPELASLAGWVACIANARPVDDYCLYLGRAGLDV